MTKLNARGVCALLLCAYTAGCATLQRQAFREPEVLVDSGALAGGLNSQHIELDFNVYNPNHYRLDASQIRFQVAVDSIDLASGAIERRVTLQPRDSATVRAPVNVDGRAMSMVVLRFLANRGTLPFHLKGTMRIETVFGGVTRPFEQRGTVEAATGRITIFKRK